MVVARWAAMGWALVALAEVLAAGSAAMYLRSSQRKDLEHRTRLPAADTSERTAVHHTSARRTHMCCRRTQAEAVRAAKVATAAGEQRAAAAELAAESAGRAEKAAAQVVVRAER